MKPRSLLENAMVRLLFLAFLGLSFTGTAGPDDTKPKPEGQAPVAAAADR